jgi:hypothetical protein
MSAPGPRRIALLSLAGIAGVVDVIDYDTADDGLVVTNAQGRVLS